jgi:hypothetical protein
VSHAADNAYAQKHGDDQSDIIFSFVFLYQHQDPEAALAHNPEIAARSWYITTNSSIFEVLVMSRLTGNLQPYLLGQYLSMWILDMRLRAGG